MINTPLEILDVLQYHVDEIKCLSQSRHDETDNIKYHREQAVLTLVTTLCISTDPFEQKIGELMTDILYSYNPDDPEKN